MEHRYDAILRADCHTDPSPPDGHLLLDTPLCHDINVRLMYDRYGPVALRFRSQRSVR
jgi:hypothetical protein